MSQIKNLFNNKLKSVYVVAEIGINHNGDTEIAKEMIESASRCGANAVKFQTLVPDELFSTSTNPKLFELSKDWILTKDQHIILKKYAEKHNLDFFSTPFGNKSIKLLRDIKIKMIKIASSDMDNFDLISKSLDLRVPLIVSTGMSTLAEIASTVQFLKQNNANFLLLHCNSSYPSKIEDANLHSIPYLKNMFSVPVGYSDHTIGNLACLTAVSLGACVLEKHFTLDKNMKGPDQKLSTDPKKFTELIKDVKRIKKSLGTPRYMVNKSETNFRQNMRKSIAAKTHLKRGVKITPSMLNLIRPGTGISPKFLNNLSGMTIKKDVKAGHLLSWTDF